MINVQLKCSEPTCAAGAILHPHFMLTRFGVFRLEGGSNGWYIDGGSVFCPSHQPDPLPRTQSKSWSEVDREDAERLLDAERGR